jgi:hypothetical protein
MFGMNGEVKIESNCSTVAISKAKAEAKIDSHP